METTCPLGMDQSIKSNDLSRTRPLESIYTPVEGSTVIPEECLTL